MEARCRQQVESQTTTGGFPIFPSLLRDMSDNRQWEAFIRRVNKRGRPIDSTTRNEIGGRFLHFLGKNRFKFSQRLLDPIQFPATQGGGIWIGKLTSSLARGIYFRKVVVPNCRHLVTK